ncbi:S41 family peptidase [Bacteroidales bacterium OttesenSCG-928-C03]|nr:S41 family peptidase [Bacteroidales bacterium OttesenSCG-928-C03]MDL2326576.1 S41 family peptidase [Bacteroidales bacterium OttesenSCG-928-A14]
MKYKNLAITFFIFLTINSALFAQNPSYSLNNTKMNQLLRSINELYVDTVNFETLVESGITNILKELDPHSAYIPKKDVQQMNEPLQGAFDGIGVTFQLIKDTINIMEVLIGGPSEKVGLMAGDKIVKVDTALATGKHVNNRWVQDHLRGPKDSKVTVYIKRGRNPELLEFAITRGKIPINSINVYFMVDSETGYIRLERFAKSSEEEFLVALTKLKARGMKNLIFDLRGNGGGYLDQAFKISNQFLDADQMIVYTDNYRHERQEYKSLGDGNFKKGKVIILVDENSASASEIVSGAIQDWDRGLIMGRRTFGKGLVQRPLNLVDKSEVRLTTHHYYTPTGRCIQKPYNDGLDKYYEDLSNRYKHGEYLTADSIKLPDSLKYYTPNKRVVYGGGGIMPDIFIPYDTTKYSSLYNELIRKGVFGGFTLDYMAENREEYLKRYQTIEDFKKNFEVSDQLYAQLMEKAKQEGVKDTLPLSLSSRLSSFVKDKKTEIDSLYAKPEDFNNLTELETMMKKFVLESYNESVKLRNMAKAPEFIKEYLKFEMARNLYNYGEAYQIFLLNDDTFQQAVALMQDDTAFKKFKVKR